jgi:hypothetical protein
MEQAGLSHHDNVDTWEGVLLMRPGRVLAAVLAVVLLAGCRTAAPGVQVQIHPLQMEGGWAAEVQFANKTNDVQIVTVRNPVYTMSVHAPDGTEVYRYESPLGREETLENILPGAHRPYLVSWNGKNMDGERVQPGTYTVKLDFNAFYGERKLAVPEQKATIR